MTLGNVGRHGVRAFAAAAAFSIAATAARADVVISSQATQNMTCTGGVCTPTATNAVLNVSDLETLLASGNVEVTTTGSGNVQASNIDVDVGLTWPGANTLSLDAYSAITINRKILVTGAGGLSLSTPNDTLLSFPKKGRVEFQNLSSLLSINGLSYTLVNSIKSLASAIAANPSGAYALANNYDAAADGTYSASPIQTTFTGNFEGLGNVVSHLSIRASGFIGLFSVQFGTIKDFGVLDGRIQVSDNSTAGMLSAGGYGGNLIRDFATGSIRGTGTLGNAIGGLSGGGSFTTYCHADVRITDTSPAQVGGLLGGNGGSIDQSFAIGSIKMTGKASGNSSYIGGLAGANFGGINNSYAIGAVTGGARSRVGGLVGENGETNGVGAVIATSYSTGAVSGGKKALVGGFAGTVYPPSGRYNKHDYWVTDTSGTDQGTGKGNKRGIVGLTSVDLQSGLPEGFDPKIWTYGGKTVNNGFPYLIANPPPK